MNKEIIEALKAQTNTRRQFKKALAGNSPTLFQLYEPSKPGGATLRGSIGKLDARLLAANAEGRQIAMVVNCVSGKRRKADRVTAVNAVFVDDDSGQATLSTYLALPCPPQVIVQTSPGRMHVYWLVADCELTRFRAVQQALAAQFGTDTSVCDLARAMRMPGTFNWKSGKPVLSTLVHQDMARERYTVDGLIDGLGLTLASDTPASGAGISTPPVANPAPARDWAEIESALRTIPSDDRQSWLVTGMALHTLADRERAFRIWADWSRTSAKYDETVQMSTWQGFAGDAGVKLATLFHMAKQGGWEACAHDELSMAALFGETYKDCIRFDPKGKQWYRFAEVVWVADNQAPLQLLRSFVVGLTQADGARRSAMSRFRSTASMKNLVAQAELLPTLHISARDFDQRPELLAVKNGVVDLTNGSFRPASPADLLLRQADVAYEADAKAPTWREFMKSIASGDLEFARFLQACAGYTMLGHSDEQAFFVVIGNGANGKGVFTRTLKRMLGGYAAVVAPNLMTRAYSGNPNSPTPALAHVAGARLILCPESGAKARMDDAFIKQLTGGDEISARTTYGEIFTFKPVGTLWLTTNHAPEIAHEDEALWRRVVPLPFNAQFRGESADVKLEEKLWAESSGILNWFVRGAVAYGQTRLGESRAVSHALKRMRRRADSVEWWVKVKCEVGEDAGVAASAAYASYRDFAFESSLPPLTVKEFSARMGEKGYRHSRRSQGVVYLGLRLK